MRTILATTVILLIVDPGEQRTLMKRILKQLNLGSEKNGNERSISGTISNAKNDLIDDVYAAQAWRYVHANRGPVLYGLPKELRQSESVDFDDLIMLTLRLFDQNLMS